MHEVRWVLGVGVLLKAQSERQNLPFVAAVLHVHVKNDGPTRDRKAREVDDPWRKPNVPQLVGDPFEHGDSGYGRAAHVDRQEVVPVGYRYQIGQVLVFSTVSRVLQVVAL